MATERSLFLINNARPDFAVSPRFEVREGAVRLTASGISGGSYVKLKKQISPQAGSFGAVWADVIRQGQAVRLSQNNMEHLELISGIYEVEFVGAGEGEGQDAGENVIVYLEEDQRGLDSKLQYTLPAYNPAFNGSVTGTGLSPALVGSRKKDGFWIYDNADRKFVWVEQTLDTSTGAVTYEYFDVPGGTVANPPVFPVPVSEQYSSLERFGFYTVTSAGGALDFATTLNGYAIKKITVMVDSGSFTLAGAEGSIVVAATEKYELVVSSNFGRMDIAGDPSLLTLTPVNSEGTDSARVIVQACLVSPQTVN